MTDRPILFSGPMVRAILDGRKTQTRRVLGTSNNPFSLFCNGWSDAYVLDPGNAEWRQREVRFEIGDRLYVREAWRTLQANDCIAPRNLPQDPSKVTFEADPERRNPLWAFGRLRPGMHMPRWASRLTLAVTDVRVQRLQAISEADAIAEGIEFVTRTTSGDFYRNFQNAGCPLMAYGAYRSLWDSLNEMRGYGWDANPWVVAVSFTVHRANIDAMPAQAA
ncbi:MULTISPECIES: hypothetical protein [Aurantimonas]|uniref:hypothetical protein n=1 Tax=Aurantimonas TaxID=182269 RepID=UPI00351895FB